MFMDVFCSSIVLLIFFVRYFEKHVKCAYLYSEMFDQNINEKMISGHISFFRSNESYSSKSDLKKILNDHFEFGGEEQLKNATQQEKLNNSKRVRQIRMKQRKQEMLRNLGRAIGALSIRDYVTLFAYIGLPFICILLLNCPQIYAFCDEMIVGVSNHRVDIYLSQLSLTFITISLMSIFSDSNAIILWENIVKKTLIDPPASCFKAYFFYSFMYLLFSTVSLGFRYDIGIGVLFVFNIVCLFDLSRTMINCYYDPSGKKKKVVKDFIRKIEEANIEGLQRGNKNASRENISEVKSTFEDFNYYINEAFNQGKYSDVREYLAVYGKLLAHVDSATIETNEIDVRKWYGPDTYKAYKDFVKNYYTECNSIALGLSNTNGQPMRSSGFERKIINKIMVSLVNDVRNAYEKEEIYSLILYALYTHFLFIARNVDVDNFDEYLIDTENIRSSKKVRDKLKEKIEKLKDIFYKNSEIYNMNCFLGESHFELVIGTTVANIILINTEDSYILELDFMCWNELRKRKRIIDTINEYVEECVESFSDERRKRCLQRKEEVFACKKE